MTLEILTLIAALCAGNQPCVAKYVKCVNALEQKKYRDNLRAYGLDRSLCRRDTDAVWLGCRRHGDFDFTDAVAKCAAMGVK